MVDTRRALTPRDVATGRRSTPFTLAPALTRQAPAEPRRPAAAGPYDRHAWEMAVQASGMRFTARLVALTLATHARGGMLPAGGIQSGGRLRELTGLNKERVQQCLRDLQKAGFIYRPPSPSGHNTHRARPLVLTLPSAAVRRQEPPSTGEAS